MFLFVALLITMILGGAEVDLFTPAFPELMHTFNLTPFTLQLITSMNLVGCCIGCLVAGFLGDRYGARNIILITLAIFIAGSAMCVASPHAKGRASAFMMAVRLLFTGIGVEVVGYYYDHTFFPLALFMAVCMTLAFIFIRYVPEWKGKA